MAHSGRIHSMRPAELISPRKQLLGGLLSVGIPAPASREGFEAWVRPHVPTLLMVAARLAPSADREDVVQDALARAWEKRYQFDGDRGTPRAWLAAITVDRARHARRRRTLGRLGDREGSARSIDERIDVELAVRSLAPRQRLAVDCFYFIGLSVAETAVVMRCADGTVKATLAAARSRLRSALGDEA